MGMFKKHNKKQKSEESIIIKGKSKSNFPFPFPFKNSNKTKSNKKNNTTDNLDEKEQGYYFVSYSKSMEIRRASSSLITNQKNLEYNPYYNSEKIESSTSPIPFEVQINHRGNKIKIVDTNHRIEDHRIKEIDSDNNIKKTSENELDSEELSGDNANIENERKNVNEGSIRLDPRHQSTISQVNDSLNKENSNNIEEIDNNSEDVNGNNLSSYSSESCSKEKSILLNNSERNDVEVDENDELKSQPVETNNTPNSTQAILRKDKGLTKSLASESLEMETLSPNELSSSEIIINANSMDKEKDHISDIKLEPRKRSYSQSNGNHFNRLSAVLIQEKKFKKDDTEQNKSRKDPNFVKNHKKRMGIITRRRGPIVEDTSIVQGVRGPWKIVETTTMTAGITTSPDIIQQAITNNTITNTQRMIFHSPSLPSLSTTLSLEEYLITRHQVMSDSLLNDLNGVQKKRSQYSLEDHDIINDEESDIISGINSEFTHSPNLSPSRSYNYVKDHDYEFNEQSSLKSSLRVAYKKSNSKLNIQNLKNKTIKAVLKHDTKKLNNNDEKKVIRNLNSRYNNF